jgi:hypothetical protein
MKANKIVSAVRVGFTILFLWLVLAGNWVNLKNESFGVFDSQGGAGFGIVAVVLGFLMLLVSLTLAAEKEFTIKPIAMGGNQILLSLGFASFITVLSFLIITHSGSFRALGDVRGAGWGAAGAGLVAYFLPQVVMAGFGFLGTSSSTPVNESDRQKIGFAVFVSGTLIAIAPLFEWFKTEEGAWTGYEPGAPRMGFLLLALGGAMALTGFMRLRPKGLVEPGGRLSHPHLQTVVSLSVIFSLFGWLITGFQRDDMSTGVGVWIGLIAGILLLGVSVFELTKREVTAS